MAFFYKKHKRRKRSTVHENRVVSPHCPQAAAVHSIARLCSNIIGAVEVFINKKPERHLSLGLFCGHSRAFITSIKKSGVFFWLL